MSSNPMATRAKLQGYLNLFSGIQIICSLYYCWQNAGTVAWVNRMKNNYDAFAYGIYGLFINGFLYHSIAKAMFKGTSGLKVQYLAIVLNVNQFISIINFFVTLFRFSPKNGFVIFQLFVYFPTLVLGCLLNYYAWNSLIPKEHTIRGSFFLGRRRDYGLLSVILCAVLFLLSFTKTVLELQFESNKKRFGKFYGAYYFSLFLIFVPCLGYHVLGLKISMGMMPCHRILVILCAIFASVKTIGLLLFFIFSNKLNAINKIFFHVVILGSIIVVSEACNIYMSWDTFSDEMKKVEEELKEIGKEKGNSVEKGPTSL